MHDICKVMPKCGQIERDLDESCNDKDEAIKENEWTKNRL